MEKGGKEKELLVHHKLEEILDQYLKATGLEKEPESPLFPAAIGKTGRLSRRQLARTDAADMLKRVSSSLTNSLAVPFGYVDQVGPDGDFSDVAAAWLAAGARASTACRSSASHHILMPSSPRKSV